MPLMFHAIELERQAQLRGRAPAEYLIVAEHCGIGLWRYSKGDALNGLLYASALSRTISQTS
jgi:hypothetical protein